MKNYVLVVIVGLVSGLVGGVLSLTILQPYLHSNASLIRDFYLTENAVHVSPHGLRTKMDRRATDFVLVDLRSRQEYEREHIVGAVNIPAYSDPDTSAYGDIERIVAAFKALPQNKAVIVYCYSMPCMTGRKIGLMLTEHSIYVQHLGIGWNEWRYFWNLWNHEHEWDITDVENYIASGPEPGEPTGEPSISPCIEGEFGC
ncbi:MAG: rhodanese-like domain-containing protein [Candidatus Peribacteraceae bacterium]|nr:rhodanese-like domain-containing protein [Candidatus Peribacteraceae bacterium]